MRRIMMKSKIHRATVTEANIEYEGSVTIDSELLEAADIIEYEQVDIYNISNGERFTTYAIQAEAGSRVISVNGAAAHKASPGDRVIICAYGGVSEAEARKHKPKLVYLDENNHVIRESNTIPVQAA